MKNFFKFEFFMKNVEYVSIEAKDCFSYGQLKISQTGR